MPPTFHIANLKVFRGTPKVDIVSSVRPLAPPKLRWYRFVFFLPAKRSTFRPILRGVRILPPTWRLSLWNLPPCDHPLQVGARYWKVAILSNSKYRASPRQRVLWFDSSWLPYSADTYDLDLSVFHDKYQWEIWKNTVWFPSQGSWDRILQFQVC